MPIPVTQIVARAAELFDTTSTAIIVPSRLRKHTRPRFAVAFAAKASKRSMSDIAPRLGYRDHTAVRYAVSQCAEWCRRDPAYLANVEALVSMVSEWDSRFGGQDLA